MFDWQTYVAPSDFAGISIGVAFILGLLAGRYRGRAGRWLSWRIYHAGVHLPRFGRR